MFLSVPKLKVSKLGPVKPTLNVNNLSLPNLITNTAAMIILISTKTPWNALVFLTLRNANMISATKMELIILNSMLLITPIPSHSLMIFKNNASLKLNNLLFRITKLNTFHYGAFAWIANSQLVLSSTLEEKAVCWDRYEYNIEKDLSGLSL